MTTPKDAQLVDAPMAVLSDGTVVFNVTHLGYGDDPLEAVRQLIEEGHEIFVGVVLPRELRHELRRDLHDVLADAVGRAGPKFRQRRETR